MDTQGKVKLVFDGFTIKREGDQIVISLLWEGKPGFILEPIRLADGETATISNTEIWVALNNA